MSVQAISINPISVNIKPININSVIQFFSLKNETLRVLTAGTLCTALHLLLLLFLIPLVQQPVLDLSSAEQGVTLDLASTILSTQVVDPVPEAAHQSEAPVPPPPMEKEPEPVIQKEPAPVVKKESKKQVVKPPRPRPVVPPSRQMAANQADNAVVSTSQAAPPHTANQEQSPTVITKPRFRVPPASPVYPQLSRQRGEEGTAMIAIRLDTNGKVREISLLRSSGYSLLDKAALKAAKKWQFLPPELDGIQQTGMVQIPVRFKLT